MSYNQTAYNTLGYNQVNATIIRTHARTVDLSITNSLTTNLSIKTQRTIQFDNTKAMTEIVGVTDTVEGETRVLEFTAEDENGVKDITGATIEWSLVDGETVTLQTSDSEVSVSIVDASNGRFDVTIDPFDVSAGGYTQRISVEDSSGNIARSVGPYRIKEF